MQTRTSPGRYPSTHVTKGQQMSKSFEGRFTVAVSAPLLTWGLPLTVVGFVVGRLASAQAASSFEQWGTEPVAWQALSLLGYLAAAVGFVLLVVGLFYLASNVDYLAAREAERHRDATEPR